MPYLGVGNHDDVFYLWGCFWMIPLAVYVFFGARHNNYSGAELFRLQIDPVMVNTQTLSLISYSFRSGIADLLTLLVLLKGMLSVILLTLGHKRGGTCLGIINLGTDPVKLNKG